MSTRHAGTLVQRPEERSISQGAPPEARSDRLKALFVGLFVSFGLGCSTAPPATGGAPSPSAAAKGVETASAEAPAPPSTALLASAAPSAASAAPEVEPPPDRDAISVADAERILFLRAKDAPPAAAACPRSDRQAAIRCLLGVRFEPEKEAAAVALGLYDATGDVAGVEPEQVMEGGFRGRIRLVPELPVGPYLRHLRWTAEASEDIEELLAEIARAATDKVRYRSRHIAYRFFRSVQRTTPSAYAVGWTIAYNVSGSLHRSAAAVRETLFHEIFHLNDAAHGDWSAHVLGAIFDSIVKKCGTNVACLRPYAPADTMVKGGTYYAFQPDNGEAVHEYAAELASRYYREHRAVLKKERPAAAPFKCGSEENKRAWSLLSREFFGGTDMTADCPR